MGGFGCARPVKSFGEIYMQADPSHTNATVHELIAKAILEALKHNGRLREHVSR